MTLTPDYTIDSNGRPNIVNNRLREQLKNNNLCYEKNNYNTKTLPNHPCQNAAPSNKLLPQRASITTTLMWTSPIRNYNHRDRLPSNATANCQYQSGAQVSAIRPNRTQLHQNKHQHDVVPIETCGRRRVALDKSEKERLNHLLRTRCQVNGWAFCGIYWREHTNDSKIDRGIYRVFIKWPHSIV